MTSSENFLREFHTAHPGVTARALARGGSYARMAVRVRRDARVLDLACGDGALLAELGPRAIGIDLTLAELDAAQGRHACACARAQALPFAAGSFDTVTCHFAFMLFDDLPAVVGELARVLAPGGDFLALLGGGPTAAGDDAFHRFLALLPPRAAPRLGDPRAKSEAGWRALFRGWRVAPFERWELDLSGTFEEVWSFLGASYEIPAERASAMQRALREATAEWGERVPCTAVAYLAQAAVIQPSSAI